MTIAEKYNRIAPVDLREPFPERHTAKAVARWFGVALSTAKLWLSDGLPYERRLRLIEAIEADLRRLEEKRAARLHKAAELRRTIAREDARRLAGLADRPPRIREGGGAAAAMGPVA